MQKPWLTHVWSALGFSQISQDGGHFSSFVSITLGIPTWKHEHLHDVDIPLTESSKVLMVVLCGHHGNSIPYRRAGMINITFANCEHFQTLLLGYKFPKNLFLLFLVNICSLVDTVWLSAMIPAMPQPLASRSSEFDDLALVPYCVQDACKH